MTSPPRISRSPFLVADQAAPLFVVAACLSGYPSGPTQAQTYGKYLEDAADHEDVAQFIRQCQQEDGQRAVRCHEFLAQLTKGGIG
jgi:hypothetical protein